MSAITICSDFGAPKNKVSHFFPIYLLLSDRPDAMILVFWMLSFKPTFSLSSFTFIKKIKTNQKKKKNKKQKNKTKLILITVAHQINHISWGWFFISMSHTISTQTCILASLWIFLKLYQFTKSWHFCIPF